METGELGPEYSGYRKLVQQAREILIQERAFSVEEANSYMYELAQGRKVLIIEVASRIVVGDWVRTEASPAMIATHGNNWLGRW